MSDVAPGVLLAHDLVGPLDRGVPVVLLHAFPLERSMWVPVAERLRAATVTVVTVDLPGLGDSPVPPGVPDLSVSAAGVLSVLDRLGIERAVVGGVSMGGYVALAIARQRPERLAGIALVDTKAEADGHEARANRLRMAEAVLGEAGTRALAPMLDTLLGATSHSTRPAVVERVREALRAAPPSGVAWSQRAMAARPDSLDVLAALRVPAVIVVGEEDGITPPSAARAMVEAIPDAVLSVVPRAGHLSPLERPDAVAHALLGLLLRAR